MPRSGDHIHMRRKVWYECLLFRSIASQAPGVSTRSDSRCVYLQRLAEQDGTFCLNCKHQTFLKKPHLCPKEHITTIQNQRKNRTGKVTPIMSALINVKLDVLSWKRLLTETMVNKYAYVSVQLFSSSWSLMFCHKHMYFPMLVTCDKPFLFF